MQRIAYLSLSALGRSAQIQSAVKHAVEVANTHLAYHAFVEQRIMQEAMEQLMITVTSMVRDLSPRDVPAVESITLPF